MRRHFLPWIRLWWMWAPALLLLVLSVGLLIWEVASPQGRLGAIEEEIAGLRGNVAHLEQINGLAVAERREAMEASEGLQKIYSQIFGSLDERLTAVMRAIGSAARDAGLLPKGFGYSFQENKKEGSIRFVTSFSVEGSYDQVRKLLATLQASPQFLIIDSISFKGEEDPRSSILRIRLEVSTFLSHTDPETLNRIVSRLRFEMDETPSSGDTSDDEAEVEQETKGGAAR